ncbi:hypothetical protein E4U41_007804 [Claviceps citrina]|nr:hypothetical protein E4U41_007804 [Claviceps citrina]
MARQKLPADLGFLTDAAHLLRQAAPETSAYLMRQRAELMHLNGLAQHETQRQHVCGACGHIMMPGQGTELKLERRPRPRAEKRTERKGGVDRAPSRAGPTKSITCGHCRRITRISLPPPDAVQRRKKPQTPAAARAEGAVPAPHAQKATANASSKKRAKGRKGGLQALLSGQQHKASNSLSLADFMG